jgi:hypothetical protein
VRSVSVVIRLGDRPADERLELAREMSASLWLPLDFHTEGVIDAEFRASGLGAAQVVVIDTTPVIVSRTRAHIAQADPTCSRPT